MQKKILIIPIILIIILSIFPINVNAYQERPTLCKSGCHERVPMGSILDSDECGTCHTYISKGFIDVPQLEQTHNQKVCKLCHGVDKGQYHTMHGNVSCSTCHGTGRQLPEEVTYAGCTSCHGVKIHDIHVDTVDERCSVCHGTTELKYPENSNKASNINQIYAKVIDYQKYTLYELIKRLFGWS